MNKKPEKPVVGGGLKAAARRSGFEAAYNKTATRVPGKENGKIGAVDKEFQKFTAISRPAQRSIALNQAAPLQQARLHKPTSRKTQVYEDKKQSPKVVRDAVTKRDSQSHAAPRADYKRIVEPARPTTRVKNQEVRDEPVYSDEQPYRFYGDYEEGHASDIEEQRPAVDTKARFNADVEAVSEDEGSVGEDHTADYSVSRSRGHEDFTENHRPTEDVSGVTAQVVLPKWNLKARKEIAELNAAYGSMIDEDEVGDISMVAEYGDEIFAYMRDLEVSYLACSFPVTVS